MNQKLYNMKFSAVYQALIAKVERKGGKGRIRSPSDQLADRL